MYSYSEMCVFVCAFVRLYRRSVTRDHEYAHSFIGLSKMLMNEYRYFFVITVKHKKKNHY